MPGPIDSTAVLKHHVADMVAARQLSPLQILVQLVVAGGDIRQHPHRQDPLSIQPAQQWGTREPIARSLSENSADSRHHIHTGLSQAPSSPIEPAERDTAIRRPQSDDVMDSAPPAAVRQVVERDHATLRVTDDIDLVGTRRSQNTIDEPRDFVCRAGDRRSRIHLRSTPREARPAIVAVIDGEHAPARSRNPTSHLRPRVEAVLPTAVQKHHRPRTRSRATGPVVGAGRVLSQARISDRRSGRRNEISRFRLSGRLSARRGDESSNHRSKHDRNRPESQHAEHRMCRTPEPGHGTVRDTPLD